MPQLVCALTFGLSFQVEFLVFLEFFDAWMTCPGLVHIKCEEFGVSRGAELSVRHNMYGAEQAQSLIFITKLKNNYSKTAKCHMKPQYDQHYTHSSLRCEIKDDVSSLKDTDFTKSALARGTHWQDCSSRPLNCKLLMSGEEFPPSTVVSLSSSVLTFQIHRRSLAQSVPSVLLAANTEARRSFEDLSVITASWSHV